jgi:hypothetical protein
MHLGHQWTGGVEHFEPPTLSLILYRSRYAVGTEDHHRVIGHLNELIYKHRTASPEILDNMSVVDDLMSDIDRSAKHFQRAIDDINGAVHARTKAPGVGQYNVH